MAKTAKPKTKVNATVTSKPLGKAMKRAKPSTNLELTRSLTRPITDEELDRKQLAKGTKRKSHGPKIKQTVVSKNLRIALKSRDVPPTEVA